MDDTYAKLFNGRSLKLPNWRNGVTLFLRSAVFHLPTSFSAVVWALGLLHSEAYDTSAAGDTSRFVQGTQSAKDASERVLTRLDLVYANGLERSRPHRIRDSQRLHQRYLSFAALGDLCWGAIQDLFLRLDSSAPSARAAGTTGTA